jgi:hypothetical protein
MLAMLGHEHERGAIEEQHRIKRLHGDARREGPRDQGNHNPDRQALQQSRLDIDDEPGTATRHRVDSELLQNRRNSPRGIPCSAIHSL